VRVSDVARHVEQKQCPNGDLAKLEAVREEKLLWARELQARHLGDYNQEVEAAYMSRNSALRPKAEATVRPYPVQFQPFESDQVDVFQYHQNVIEAGRNARLTTSPPANPSTPPAQSSQPDPATDRNPQQPQPLSKQLPSPTSIEKWKQGIPRAGATLLDDFDPAQNDKLQPSIIDYYDPGDEEGSGRPGPWSAFFNPWENDDLIGLSSCSSSGASSPVAPRFPNTRNQSPAATIHHKSPARTVVTIGGSSTTVTIRAASPTKKAALAMAARTLQGFAPVEPPAARHPSALKQLRTPHGIYGGRPATTYNPRTLVPLRNYKTLMPSNTSNNAVPPARSSSPLSPPRPTQAMTPLKASQALTPSKASLPVQMPLLPEPASVSQILTPTRGPGAVVPAQVEKNLCLDDYDDVKQAIINEIARHNPTNPNFCIRAYYDARIGKYKCPIPQCL